MQSVAAGYAGLAAMYRNADQIDRREGRLAYTRYHQVMRNLSDLYGVPLHRVVAAFVSLSPNNDYLGNLRSTATLLDGINKGVPVDRITVATYGHCRARAFTYATGAADFLAMTKGPKIISFYRNILDPIDPDPVTVDGHMVATWRQQNLTMKEAICTRSEYVHIRDACRTLASVAELVPCQLQATIWFARKRTMNVLYDGQLGFFQASDDAWKTLHDVDRLKLYPPVRSAENIDKTTVACYRQGTFL